MDTRFWGPSAWRLLHMQTFAIAHNLMPKSDALKTFFEQLPFILPCKYCRASLAEYYAKHSLEDAWTSKDAFALAKWLYNVHNEVNAKLAQQGLQQGPNPSYSEVKAKYMLWLNQPCVKYQILGWDFFKSVAYITPSKSTQPPVPMKDAPVISAMNEYALNKYNLLPHSRRIKHLQLWWNSIGPSLPLEHWRSAWDLSLKKNGKAPIIKGKRLLLSWLFRMQNSTAEILGNAENSTGFHAFCKEAAAFSSNCNSRKKTCRATKIRSRSSIRASRSRSLEDTAGFL